MNTRECPCKKKTCERHGNCDACKAYHHSSNKHRPVACERKNRNGFYTEILRIVVCLIAIQFILIAVKRIIFSYAEETLFSRSMVTLISMIVIFAVILLYCKQKQYRFSVFPKKFGVIYIIATLLTIVFYVITLVFVKTFTIQNVLILFYGSIITPIFEELLFRGFIWIRLNKHLDKEWKTYIIVTILFALWHIGYAIGLFLWSAGNLLNIIVMKVLVGTVFGVVTGALRYKTKNCYLGILVHGVFNVLG